LFLEDQNQKYFPGSEQKIRGWRASWRSARTPIFSLPAFPPSCCFLLDPHIETEDRHGSFCELGRGLAAHDVM
jgi:hypothetical protein